MKQARNSQICALSGPHSQNCEEGMSRVPRLGARKADPASIIRSRLVMSIVINLESSDLDIIAIVHTAFSCVCSMSGGGPGHRSDSDGQRPPPTMLNQLTMMSRHVIMWTCHVTPTGGRKLEGREQRDILRGRFGSHVNGFTVISYSVRGPFEQADCEMPIGVIEVSM